VQRTKHPSPPSRMTSQAQPIPTRQPAGMYRTAHSEQLALSEVWLPLRWRRLELAGARQQRFIAGVAEADLPARALLTPAPQVPLSPALPDIQFGLLAILGTAAALLAPPFSGLDTLPGLGVVILSLSVLLEDVLVALVGLLLAATGIALELALGAAAFRGISSIV
jgi:hypothetical protein